MQFVCAFSSVLSWCAVLPPSRHHGLLCCLGMLKSLRERSTNVRLPHWHRAEEKMAGSSQQEQFHDQQQQNMWCNYIQTLHLHFFTKRKPHHWESLMFCLIQKNRERLEKHRVETQGAGWGSQCRYSGSIESPSGSCAERGSNRQEKGLYTPI